MKTFTFDTNCIIHIDDNRDCKDFILKITDAHRNNQIHAAFVAVSASERQPGDSYLETYSDFTSRLARLGLQDIPHINGMSYWGLSYWNHAIYASEDMVQREREIHGVLFPNTEFRSADFNGRYSKWRNAWCDRQMIWSHEHHSRDIFVTSDKNFRKLNRHAGFENIVVCSPEEAASLLPE